MSNDNIHVSSAVEKDLFQKKIISFNSNRAEELLDRTGSFNLAVGGFIEVFTRSFSPVAYLVQEKVNGQHVLTEYETLAESANYIISKQVFRPESIPIEKSRALKKPMVVSYPWPYEEIMKREGVVYVPINEESCTLMSAVIECFKPARFTENDGIDTIAIDKEGNKPVQEFILIAESENYLILYKKDNETGQQQG